MSQDSAPFGCTSCGHELSTWAGQCPECGSWNTIEERPDRTSTDAPSGGEKSDAGSTALVEADASERGRLSTGFEAADFVLGGGLVVGSIVLVGGPPGAGKSTLLAQVAGRLLDRGRRPLYVSGEESAGQVRQRAERLGGEAPRVPFVGKAEVGHVLEVARAEDPDVLIVDSVQTLRVQGSDGGPGSVKQVRTVTDALRTYGKRAGVTVVLTGHVTKGGKLAGPKQLEHMVDTVLTLTPTGRLDHRVLRARKNRFGSVDEVGVFEMGESGLAEVDNPARVFLGRRQPDTSGSVVTATRAGSRSMVLEVQGLAAWAERGSPERSTTGFSRRRLSMLLAVLDKRAQLPFRQMDAFVNVVGGWSLDDPGADAAVALALASSAAERPVGRDRIVIGEVGLGGELRPAARMGVRLQEADRLGFEQALVPEGSLEDRGGPDGLSVETVATLPDLIERALGPITDLSADEDGSREGGTLEARAGSDGRRELDL